MSAESATYGWPIWGDVVPANAARESQAVTLCAVGDVLLKQSDPKHAFEHVKAALAEADIRFANCEAVYSTTSERNPASSRNFLCNPRNIAGLSFADFNVMSLANNHAMDCGYSGLSDTINHLKAAAITPVGAGADRRDATAARFVQVNDVRVAFLAYTCHYVRGFEAREDRPGCATIAVRSSFEEQVGHPGEVARVYTFAVKTDKDEFKRCVACARDLADYVCVSFHWGLGSVRSELADYERELARAATDAGANLVLGHGQHIIKGIEFRNGTPIVYGMGNFVFNSSSSSDPQGPPADMEDASGDECWLYPFKGESRMSMLLCATFEGGGVSKLHIRPVVINRSGQPIVLRARDVDFGAYLAYLEAITLEAGLNARYATEGDAIRTVSP